MTSRSYYNGERDFIRDLCRRLRKLRSRRRKFHYDGLLRSSLLRVRKPMLSFSDRAKPASISGADPNNLFTKE